MSETSEKAELPRAQEDVLKLFKRLFKTERQSTGRYINQEKRSKSSHLSIEFPKQNCQIHVLTIN